MGVMSRRVLPVCGNLCFFCPAMRARSRQPVKRYKRLLAEIFPRSQEPEPNDRKIGKLCEYASKNPLRIPKITEYLEQKFYKDLRNENFASVHIVLCVYRKLLSSCKEQMSLFASSLLGLVRTLLEQTRDETRILGCSVLVDFIKCQTESTYMFNLEGLIPKLCQLAQEVGDDARALRLRSAGLQALASMVWFMGEHSHISMDFDIIISVTLENYLDLPVNLEKDQLGSPRGENNGSAFPDISKNIPSFLDITNSKLELDNNVDTSISPSYWSRICLYNMARLAKEATTVRRVLEPLFHSFDAENHWSSEKGLALSVLKDVQSLLEESGINSHLLLSIMVKHLDHKAIVKQPVKQIPIVSVITQLAQNAKQEASVAIIGAISDLIRHVRKCMQYSAEASNCCDGLDKGNSDLQLALEECILQLSKKVGDAGPVLDMMAVTLENIPINAIGARPTILSIYRAAQMISILPNVTYHKKAFPDALFHQLLLAMGHPDHETRVVAHHVFSVVLMPSLVCPWFVRYGGPTQTLPGLSPVASRKIKSISLSVQDEKIGKVEPADGLQVVEVKESPTLDVSESLRYGSLGRSCTFRNAMVNLKMEPSSLRLSSHQVSLLLSEIWVHATSTENTPTNFEAMAHTYSICLLFTRNKNSSHMALVRCLQLAFSLRRVSLDQEGAGLQPSRRRSLFTTASCMLIFSARAGNLPELIPLVKSSLTDETVDPYLNLVENIRLIAVDGNKEKEYGSQEDEVASLKSLSAINIDDIKLKETVVSLLMARNTNLPEDDLSSMRRQILEVFSPDDAYPLGASIFMETPRPCSPLNQMDSLAFDEVTLLDALTDEEAFPEPSGSESGRKTSLSMNSLDILSVNQLLESVLETARQVASLPVSSTPVPYDQMKNQCEALVTGKQQKMSVLQSFKPSPQDAQAIVVTNERKSITSCLSNLKIELSEGELKLTNVEKTQGRDNKLVVCSLEYGQQQSFKLPPSSPYDKFLKAAGC